MLKYLLEQWLSSPKQQKCFSKMLRCDCEIKYKNGKENGVVDAISRKYDQEESLFSLYFLITDSLQEVCQ